MTEDIARIRREGRRLAFAGFAAVALLLGGAATWATLARIDGAVIGSGTLAIAGSAKEVQHRTGGRIAEILVAEGDLVAAGAPLIRLDDSVERSALGVIDVRADAAAIRLDRLRAELDGRPFAPALDLAPHLDSRHRAAAVGSEQALYDARRAELDGIRAQIRSQIDQLVEQQAGLAAGRAATLAQIDLVSREMAPIEDLFSRGLTTQSRLMALKRARAAAEGDLGRADADLAEVAERMAEARERLAQVERDFRSKVAAELRDAEAEGAELAERRRAAADALEATTLRAPVGGYVHQLAVHTVGGVVAPGATMLSLVPQDAPLTAEVMVDPTEIDQVNSGAAANLRLLAGNQRLAPVLSGQVARVDRNVTVDRSSGRSFYRVSIDVPATLAGEIGGMKLVAGMPLRGFILTEARSPMDFLLAPLLEQMSHAWRER